MTTAAFDRLAEVAARHDRRELSAGIALGQLLLTYRDVDTLRGALAAAAGLSGRGCDAAGRAAAGSRSLLAVLDANRAGATEAAAILARMVEGEAAGPAQSLEAGLAGMARLFDEAVRVNPAASVALYSLGSPGLLAEATEEVVALAAALGVATPGRHLLDFGCGIGRLEPALAPRVASVTGVDVSPAMIEVARERCASLANVRLLQTSGRDLAAFADGTFDAAVAVDSFPYLYQVGGAAFAKAQLAEIARVLRPGGDVLILNLSYRGDLALDREDAREFADALRLALLRDGTADLRSWDGLTFHLRRPG